MPSISICESHLSPKVNNVLLGNLLVAVLLLSFPPHLTFFGNIQNGKPWNSVSSKYCIWNSKWFCHKLLPIFTSHLSLFPLRNIFPPDVWNLYKCLIINSVILKSTGNMPFYKKKKQLLQLQKCTSLFCPWVLQNI